jgi:hypothetical protein
MRRLLFAAIASLALVAACGKDATGPSAMAGTYILRTVDGIVPPVILFSDDTETDELVSGEVRLSADGTFVDITAERYTVNGDVTIREVEATGTFRREGDRVIFRMDNGNEYEMAVSGDSLIQDWYGLELVYTR